MKAFNHFASLIVASWAVGYFIGKVVPQPASMLLCIIVGMLMGFNWSKITGYKIGGKGNEQ